MFIRENVTIPFFPDVPSRESRNELPEKIENGALKGVEIPLLKSSVILSVTRLEQCIFSATLSHNSLEKEQETRR